MTDRENGSRLVRCIERNRKRQRQKVERTRQRWKRRYIE